MLGTVTDLMAAPGELLTLEDYGSRCERFLDGMRLEHVVSSHLEVLGVDHFWVNKNGESNSFPDIFVGPSQISVDCKGSERYYGSMFLGVDSYAIMADRVERYGQIWYVLNDLSVVSFTELDACKERKQGGYRVAPDRRRTINQWLEELNEVQDPGRSEPRAH